MLIKSTSFYRVYRFNNGFGASVIKDGYGKEQGLMELAVLKNNALCYTTDITNDVIGYLTEDDVQALLKRIEALNPNGKETPQPKINGIIKNIS